MTKPNYDRAATLAVRTLIELDITSMPIFPWFIIPRCKNTALASYDDLARYNGISSSVAYKIMEPAKDAVTYQLTMSDMSAYYIIAYNKKIRSIERIRFTLAHELGHRVMGHSEKEKEWEEKEANHFAMHLLFPRPVLMTCFKMGMQPLAMNLYNLTNCSIPCINTLQYVHPSTVPAKYNKKCRSQFLDHLDNLFYYSDAIWKEESRQNPRVMLGRYFEGYTE